MEEAFSMLTAIRMEIDKLYYSKSGKCSQKSLNLIRSSFKLVL